MQNDTLGKSSCKAVGLWTDACPQEWNLGVMTDCGTKTPAPCSVAGKVQIECYVLMMRGVENKTKHIFMPLYKYIVQSSLGFCVHFSCLYL